jgi:hypothetical protein
MISLNSITIFTNGTVGVPLDLLSLTCALLYLLGLCLMLTSGLCFLFLLLSMLVRVTQIPIRVNVVPHELLQNFRLYQV